MSLSARAGLISDVVISIPIEDVKKSSGLGLDIGSSIGKIVYRSNKEYKNGHPIKQQGETSKGQVHFAMFPRGDVEGMIKYIKDNCDLVRDETGQVTVNSSGTGGVAFKTAIEDGLSCRMNVMTEFDYFCKAFLALEKILSVEDMFIPVSPDVKAEAAKAKDISVLEKYNAMKGLNLEEDKTTAEEEVKLDHPRLLVIAGSGTGLMQINKDGTFNLIDFWHPAGRTMYGLASILSGENEYEALTEMARKADGKSVDTWLSDLLNSKDTTGPKGGIYHQDEDKLSFPFGEGVTTEPGEMKKEDLVWSVFNVIAMGHGHVINLHVKLTKAKVVYIAGNVFNTAVTSHMLFKALSREQRILRKKDRYDIHFVKNGGMFAALGAYLHT